MVNALKEPSEPGTGNGGTVVFSGIKPDEASSLKAAYGEYLAFDDDAYAEVSFIGLQFNIRISSLTPYLHLPNFVAVTLLQLAATDTKGSLSNYGFDVGTWCRVVGRRKAGRGWSREMSEAAMQ